MTSQQRHRKPWGLGRAPNPGPVKQGSRIEEQLREQGQHREGQRTDVRSGRSLACGRNRGAGRWGLSKASRGEPEKHRKTAGTKNNQEGIQRVGRGKGAREGEVKRMNMCYTHGPAPRAKCDHSVLQMRTVKRKVETQKREEKPQPPTEPDRNWTESQTQSL